MRPFEDHFLTHFREWHDDRAETLPLRLVEISASISAIRLRIEGVTEELAIHVTEREEIAVTVEVDGTDWDTLALWEAPGVVVEGGVACVLCSAEERTVHADYFTLWTEEAFEPFARWLATDLVPAANIGLGGAVGGSRWAVLLRDGEDRGYQRRIPIWIRSGVHEHGSGRG